MSTYLLSQIRNFKQCHVIYQDRLEVEAVADAVMSVWPGFECVEATVEHGVAQDDLRFAQEIIEEGKLDCTVEQVQAEILRVCKGAVE